MVDANNDGVKDGSKTSSTPYGVSESTGRAIGGTVNVDSGKISGNITAKTRGGSTGKRVTSSTKDTTLYQNVTIDGKVYDNVTEKEMLANKLSSTSKAILDTERTATRDAEVVKDQTRLSIAKKVDNSEPLTAEDKYFLLTGDTKASVESTNKFLEKSGSSAANVAKTKGNVENLYNYDKEAQDYQKKKKEQEAARNAPNTTTYTTNTKYSENWGVRTSEKWAEKLVGQEKKAASDRQTIREAYGLTGLDPKESDSGAVKTFKALGNIVSAFTFELGSTAEYTALTANKAAFSFFSAGVGATTSDIGFTRNVAGSVKSQAIGGVDAVTPIKIDSLVKGEGLKYDPQGTANLIFASAVANVQAGIKLRDPRVKTTGKVESKNIAVKGKIEVKGTTTGKPTTIGSKQTLSLKFQEKASGIFGKKISTTIERTQTGTIIKTQQLSPKSYVRSTQVKGSNSVIVEKVVNGKLTRTYVAKGSGLKSEFTQYESIIKAKTNTAIQPADNTLLQTGVKQTFQNVKGKVSKTQTAKGPLKVTTKAETVSQAGQGTKVTAGTSKSGLSLKEFEVTQGKLGIGKGAGKLPLESENIGGTVTLTQKPTVNTAYQYTTDITGNLKVSNLPSKQALFFKSQRGSLGADPILAERNVININEISTPTIDASFTLPRVANSFTGSPTLAAPIDLSSFSTGRATADARAELKPNSDLINQPTLSLTPISRIDLTQSSRSSSKGSQILKQTAKQAQDKINIQESDIIQQPSFKEIQPVEPATKKQTLALNFGFQTPKTEVPIIVPAPLIAAPTIKASKQRGFNVITRKGGKDLLLTSKPLTEKEALNFGSSIVGSSARASFRLVETSGPLGSFSGKGLLGDFYKSKSGAFVEKREKRINTAGELKEITFSPLNTKDKKKKGGKKKKSPFSIKGGLF